jgi:hypothetical protein
MEAVGDFVDDPHCDIDTSGIMTKEDANAPCTPDTLDNCAQVG